jgi:uncharacterized protein (TIGR00730 family)
MNPIRRVCVNCGSSLGLQPEYAASARALGQHLAEQGIGVVFGGADLGLMGEVADAALAAGGRVTGVIHESIAEKVGHHELAEMHVVGSMHERKKLMFELADAFVALPGGLGTLDELFEVLTWAQLGYHEKPYGLLNACGFYNGLLGFLDHAVAQRFIKPEHRSMLVVETTPPALLDGLRRRHIPQLDKWI